MIVWRTFSFGWLSGWLEDVNNDAVLLLLMFRYTPAIGMLRIVCSELETLEGRRPAESEEIGRTVEALSLTKLLALKPDMAVALE
jgi:hypothetical protein